MAEQALLAAVDGDARSEQRWQLFVEKAGEGFGTAAIIVITGQRRGVVTRALRQIEHFAAGVADADECQRAFFARAGRVKQGLRERQRVGEVGVAVEQVQHRIARRQCLADGGGLDAVTAPAVGGSDGGFGGLWQLRGLPVGRGRAERGGKEEGFFHGFSRVGNLHTPERSGCMYGDIKQRPSAAR